MTIYHDELSWIGYHVPSTLCLNWWTHFTMIKMFHSLSRYQSRTKNVRVQHWGINIRRFLQIPRFQAKWRNDLFVIDQRKKFWVSCIVNQYGNFTSRKFLHYLRNSIFNFGCLTDITLEPTLNSIQSESENCQNKAKIWSNVIKNSLGSLCIDLKRERENKLHVMWIWLHILNRFLKLVSVSVISRRERPTTSSCLVSKSFFTIPSPIPLEAPVTTAIDPWNFSIFSLEFQVWFEHQSLTQIK